MALVSLCATTVRMIEGRGVQGEHTCSCLRVPGLLVREAHGVAVPKTARPAFGVISAGDVGGRAEKRPRVGIAALGHRTAGVERQQDEQHRAGAGRAGPGEGRPHGSHLTVMLRGNQHQCHNAMSQCNVIHGVGIAAQGVLPFQERREGGSVGASFACSFGEMLGQTM